MIIWRGWGIIGVGFALLGCLLGLALWTAFGEPTASPGPFMGPGLVLAGVGTYLLGQRLNVTGVDAKTEQYLAPRRQQLHELVHSGQFQMAPGMPQPSSLEEAQAQASHLLEQERQQVHRQLKDRHTLFFIPVQWVGLFVAFIGIVVLVVTVVVAVTG